MGSCKLTSSTVYTREYCLSSAIGSAGDGGPDFGKHAESIEEDSVFCQLQKPAVAGRALSEPLLPDGSSQADASFQSLQPASELIHNVPKTLSASAHILSLATPTGAPVTIKDLDEARPEHGQAQHQTPNNVLHAAKPKVQRSPAQTTNMSGLVGRMEALQLAQSRIKHAINAAAARPEADCRTREQVPGQVGLRICLPTPDELMASHCNSEETLCALHA